MSTGSLIERSGLPDSFGYALLLVGLGLLLAPYLRGADFGIFKIPDFDEPTRKVLQYLGPIWMALAIAIHFPYARTQDFQHDPPRTAEEDRRASVSETPSEISAGRRFLVPLDGGECLYPATVHASDSSTVDVLFDFGQAGTSEAEQLREIPQAPVEPSVADRVYVKLEASNIWAPGMVMRISKDVGAYVMLDTNTDCSEAYPKPYVWAKPPDMLLVLMENYHE